MTFHGSLIESAIRAGLLRHIGSGSRSLSESQRARGNYPISEFPASFFEKTSTAGLANNFKVETQNPRPNFGVTIIRSLPENVSLPYALSFHNYIHSGKTAEVEVGPTPKENGNDVFAPRPFHDLQAETQRALIHLNHAQENGNNGLHYYRRPFPDRQMEANAYIVHMKLMRNNCFITVTDSKGNTKLGMTAGKLAGKSVKLARYFGDAAAEDIGRRVREMKMKSVVVKVNGFTFFNKKKKAILSFKDGYTNSRGNVMNPIVYIEDTTRKPHNGCRLSKRRRKKK